MYAKDKKEGGRWYLGTAKTIGSHREVFICDTLYHILLDYKKPQDRYKREYSNSYKKYSLQELKNKYGKLVEYKIVESKYKCSRVEMVLVDDKNVLLYGIIKL